MRTILLATLLAATMCNAGCESPLAAYWNQKPAPPMRTLYDRIGGKDRITLVVDDFVGRMNADPKINFTRQGISGGQWEATPDKLAFLKSQLVDYISQITGGPKNYKADYIRRRHTKMQIAASEYDAAQADLKSSLDQFKIPAREQAEVLTLFANTKKQIISR